MSVRIRKNGRMFCAAMFPAEKGDKYIDDTMHEILSLNAKVLVSEPHERHKITGEWWWINNIPNGVEIDDFYMRMQP